MKHATKPAEPAKKNAPKTEKDSPANDAAPRSDERSPRWDAEQKARWERGRSVLKEILRDYDGGVSEPMHATPASLMLHALSTEPVCIAHGILYDVAACIEVLRGVVVNDEIGEIAECAVKPETAERFLWMIQRKVEAATNLMGVGFTGIIDEIKAEGRSNG